jgi:hypothetical protein
MQDVDRDGIAERWNISLRVKKPNVGGNGQNGVLRKADLVVGFKWETSEIVKTEMETVGVISVQDYTSSGSRISAGAVKTIGRLELRQEEVSKMTRDMNRRYNDDFFLKLANEPLSTFLTERYLGWGRNDTTKYTYETFITQSSSQLSYLDINMVFNIPRDQSITYAPGML